MEADEFKLNEHSGGQKQNKSESDSLCTTATNPGKDSVFPQHHPLPVCPEDVSRTTFITHYQFWMSAAEQVVGDEGLRGPYLLSSFVRQHSELHREALQ